MGMLYSPDLQRFSEGWTGYDKFVQERDLKMMEGYIDQGRLFGSCCLDGSRCKIYIAVPKA